MYHLFAYLLHTNILLLGQSMFSLYVATCVSNAIIFLLHYLIVGL